MALGYTQTNRQLAVDSPLGQDALLLASFSGEEHLSQLFEYQLDLLSETPDIAAKDIVGQGITFTLQRVDAAPRHFHGLVRRFSAGNLEKGGLRSYRAVVVPWLWLLGQTADCRIFQDKTAPEIIEQVFKDLGCSDYKLSLQGTYRKREYCVQFRETDLDFVSRLMEQEGIYYYFLHEKGKHTLALADGKTGYFDCPEAEVEYSAGTVATNHVHSWTHRYEFRPGKWTANDYNFETPSTSLAATTKTVVDLTGTAKYERYDHPGGYGKKADGEAIVKLRMEEEEAGYEVVDGGSNCCTFTPGGKFKLTSHDCASEEGKKVVVTRIDHAANDNSFAAGGDGGFDYRNSFTCIPETVCYRPPHDTRRPSAPGLQTAVVVGPAGEEVYTDKYGRVKVQFFWDREGKKDEKSSCWIRVAEGLAGNNWGITFHPRIGQEVVVAFLDGDPDRPLITGSVYNAEQMPPYELPKNQTRSVIKTRSSAKGTTDNFNELRFEDMKDKEEIYIHAERDFNRVVENNDTLKVGFDKKDAGDQTIEIYNNRTVTLDQGHDTLQIKQGNHEITIDTGNETVTIKQGNQTTKVSAGKIETEAMQSIEFKVGGSSIKIEPAKITISSVEIALTGEAKIAAEAPMIQVGGSAMLELKGGMVKIN